MNRFKKEEYKQYKEKTENMSIDEKMRYDSLLSIKSQFKELVKELHAIYFPEEYDFTLDDIVDAKRRAKGENPMSNDYIKKINEKRIKLGFLPLSQNGYAQDGNATLEYCKKLIFDDY